MKTFTEFTEQEELNEDATGASILKLKHFAEDVGILDGLNGVRELCDHIINSQYTIPNKDLQKTPKYVRKMVNQLYS